MKKQTHTIGAALAAVSFSVFAVTGIAYAANIDAKSQLGGGSGDSFSFQDATIEVGSIKVGKQGSGGVTFFNGTIINNTTTNGVDNPVTISDNLRVDGGIQRGHNLPSDTWGLKFLDDARVYGDLNVDDTITASDDVNVGKNLIVQGDTTLNGDVTWAAKKSYVQVPAVDFVVDLENPSTPTSDYSLLGVSNISGSPQSYYAPVALPHGARVTKVSAMMYDNSAIADVGVTVTRIGFGSLIVETLAAVGTSGASSDYQVLDDTSIDFASIDNESYYYVAALSLPLGTADHVLQSVRVEYEITSPY